MGENMKLKNRIIVSFFCIVFVPLILSVIAFAAVVNFQVKDFERRYEIENITYENLSNNTVMLSGMTKKNFMELKEIVKSSPEQLEDLEYIKAIDQELQVRNSCLLVRKGDEILYYEGNEHREKLKEELPKYGAASAEKEGGVYIGGELKALVKQLDFRYCDGDEGSVFILSEADGVIPQVKQLALNLLLLIVIILILTASGLCMWIYQGVLNPLNQLREATHNIKEGNLDFTVEKSNVPEIRELCEDFDEMRIRLKQNAEDRIAFDNQNKELISNISHDLKTPITAVKGYVEGIMDGVADTPEKMDRYIRTIYTKANEMNHLINELTFYSKIDTNRIPYTFSKIRVNDYFEDCVEELSAEMESKGIEFSYQNLLQDENTIIADAEQLKRVINNIVNNSLKYMDKKQGRIGIRLRDVGDFIQIEIQDNGKGIAQKDLGNIFDRFYRTDASRNSSKGGSGIGLSIVKKIMEDHGGQVWAASKEGEGTTMYLALRKYQEVPIHE